MAFTRISNASLNSRGATTLPDQPTISAPALKEEFDAPAKKIVAPAVNNLMDELEATTSAGNIGAQAPSGRTGTTAQGVINSVSSDLAAVEAQAHTHTNKAVIDKFNDTGTGLTYDGNPVGAVTSVNSQTGAVVLTASDVGALPSTTAIPSKTSDLTNDSGFITASDIPTIPSKTSDLTNDSNFVADASYVHTDNNYDATDKAIVSGVTAAIAAKSTVSWNQIDTTGTKIAEITIDGVTTDVKATGGGGSADAYKTIDAGGTSFVASGADTFKINAGSNVTITPLTGDKGIQISAAGGGTSTGDMLMTDYDSQGDVKTAGGIDAYVSAEIGKLDGTVSGSAGTGNTLTAFSQTDGKVSATFGAISITKSQVSDFPSLATVATSGAYADLTGKPSIPTVTDTYSGTSSNGMSGKAVKSAIDALDVTVSGMGVGKTLASLTETDGKIAATFQNISITKSQISDFPTIPTVNNATLTIQKNGSNVQTFTANQSTNATANIVTGAFIKTASVANNAVTFTGINDSGTYGYDVFFNITGSSTNKSPYAKLTSISGAGTSNMSLTYETDADSGTNNARLYQYK